MKIAFLIFFSILLFLSSLFVTVIGEENNCDELDIETDVEQAINGKVDHFNGILQVNIIFHAGTKLQYCQVNELQCCDNEYFERRSKVIIRLITGDIRDAINGQIERFDDIVVGVETGT